MKTFGKIKKGEYFDSVTLMRIGRELSQISGVDEAAVIMGTNENKNILKASNLLLPEFQEANDTDLLVVISLNDESIKDEIYQTVDQLLVDSRKKASDSDEYTPRSLEGAIDSLTGANIALISIAGKYAAFEALKALNSGLNVMLFSDNISIDKELELKKLAHDKGLLVMGPDCGTAIINGVPLAFANVVNRGDIGIVAASGTGLQELTSIISNENSGISQAIGTGGRDVKEAIGGITFIDSIKALANDDNTKVILLAGKPPHKDVLSKIASEVKKLDKPVVSVFLGAENSNIGAECKTFEEAALKAVALSNNQNIEDVEQLLQKKSDEIKASATNKAKNLNSTQKYIRGLYSGGTFCTEAQIVLKESKLDMYSNAPITDAKKLTDSLKSQKHTFVDLGEDEFTAGKPHPMIDYSLRNKRIVEEANDKETALILVDVVLGYGSNLNPGDDLKEVITTAASKVCTVCSITGTNGDPQGRDKIAHTLKDCGALIYYSNAEASKFAKYFIESAGR